MLRIFLCLSQIVIGLPVYAQRDTLSINMKKGEMYALDYKMTSVTNTILSGLQEANTQKVHIELEGGLIFTVKEVLVDRYRVQAYYNSFAVKSETPKVKFSVNTQHTDSNGVGEDELEFRKKISTIINQPFYLTISNAGAIQDIDGLDQLIEKLTLEVHLDQPSSQSIAQILGSSMLGLSLMYLSNIYPENGIVSSNMPWTNNLPLTNKTQAHFVNTYTYTKSDSAFSITGDGRLADYKEMMTIFSGGKTNELESQFTATARIDPKTCWPIDVAMKEQIQMKVSPAENTFITNNIIIDVYYKGRKVDL